jgi:hypothetical protein
MRNHYGSAEKRAGYDCIKHYAKRVAESGEAPGDFGKQDDIRNIGFAYKTFFSDWAWPGGYPIIFVTDSGDCFCAKCAKRYFIMERKDITADCYYEGTTIECDDCGREIESGYGDPENGD